uniref:Uncharacterized protein n=1 Tax=Chromera velia CCMP2878 TaxID=1169474 RepID=A0A0G4HLP2_9ALVE|eukprot:Cvel_1165.t1-p1 / transcript=Cvel_1165.t1 / gene=Cvel_1165 / organism=Chromera_velia_CCMP2878 / gene_product=hypothetical protein / transcript_product=hypothetical protein / location=Cvel_scaffold38:145405-145683(-) / protein_length=93 / sequence_SO=supercontig / SO=protein_coding / is_pseudo=false
MIAGFSAAFTVNVILAGYCYIAYLEVLEEQPEGRTEGTRPSPSLRVAAGTSRIDAGRGAGLSQAEAAGEGGGRDQRSPSPDGAAGDPDKSKRE